MICRLHYSGSQLLWKGNYCYHISMRYLGLLRLYSLADLILLLIALHAPLMSGLGIVVTWLSFLALLEARHKHSYRPHVSHWLWIVGFTTASLLFPRWELAGFFVLSYIYTLKDTAFFGLFSPLVRGTQTTLIISSLTGYHSAWPWVGGVLILVRNFLGDIRDTKRDKREHVTTWATQLNLVTKARSIHLIAVLVTSAVWWSISQPSPWFLAAAWAIEIATYDLTAR